MLSLRMRLLFCAFVVGFSVQTFGQIIGTDQYVFTSVELDTPGGFFDDDDESLDAMTDLQDQGPTWSAHGKARGSVLGNLGAYAAISGMTDEENVLKVEAGVQQWTDFTIESDTLNIGDPISGIFTLDIDGTLRLTPTAVPDLEFASVFVFIEWFRNDVYQDTLVEASGDLYADGMFTFGDWVDEDWATSQQGDMLIASLDLMKEFTFDAKVGDKISIIFDLSVDAWEFTENATVFAEADFYNTAGFDLGAEEAGVQFVQLELPAAAVPEPASVIGWLGGAMLLARFRGRRRSRS